MATATLIPADIRALSLSDPGEFECLSNPQIQAVLDDVALQVNLDVCTDLGPLICKNLTAHILVMRMRSGTVAAGPVASESADGISRSYSTSGIINKSEAHAYFSQTSYGQEYLRLLRILPATPLALNTRFGFLYDTVP